MTTTDDMICHCGAVSESQIVDAIRNGARSLKAIQESTGACVGDRCKELNPKGRCCSDDILAIITRETGITSPSERGCCR